MTEKEIKPNRQEHTLLTEDAPPVEQIVPEHEEAKTNQDDAAEPTSLTLFKTNFDNIYDKLHNKYPDIINIEKPVLLAVGVREEIAWAIGVPGNIISKWLAWYFRRSKYYKMHKEGAKRYNLLGEEIGMVTPDHMRRKAQDMEERRRHRESMALKISQDIPESEIDS